MTAGPNPCVYLTSMGHVFRLRTVREEQPEALATLGITIVYAANAYSSRFITAHHSFSGIFCQWDSGGVVYPEGPRGP